GVGWAVSYPGHPSLDGIGISAYQGKEYPPLTLAQYTGRKFAHGNIELVNSRGQVVLTVALTNVVITGTATAHNFGADRVPVEYGLLADGVTWTYFGVDHSGA